MNLLRVLSLAGGVLVLGCGCAWGQASDDAPLPLEPPLNSAPRETAPGTVETPRAEPATDPPDVPESRGRTGESTDWRRTGPPADPPDQKVSPAPGPGTFHIPGTYIPDGDRVVWRPGFWTASQPGWEWIPARWVRQSDGWSYRDGYWGRVNANRGIPPFRTGEPRPAPGDRHVVSRPAPGASPRRGVDGALDLEPIPDEDLARAEGESVGPGLAPPAEDRRQGARPEQRPVAPADPPDPRVISPGPVVIRPGLPIPYWDGRRLVLPPTRFGAGVIIDTPGLPGDDPSPFPLVGIIPPRGANRGFLPDGRPIPPGGVIVGPRGGVMGGRVRGFLGRVLP